MANRVFGLAAVLLALAMPRSGAAQDEPAKIPPGAPTASINGTVLSMGTEELVIETKAGRQTFIVDAKTALPKALAIGACVTVDYQKLDDGRMHASRVTVDSADLGPPRAVPTLSLPRGAKTGAPRRPAVS
jgi:hypothetical protein